MRQFPWYFYFYNFVGPGSKEILGYTIAILALPDGKTVYMGEHLNSHVVSYGTLSLMDAAMVMHWLRQHVSQNPAIFMKAPLFHALNLLLAVRNNMAVEDAWRIFQIEDKGLGVQQGIDLDVFALNILEALIFDQKASLGVFALSQWGLDAGPHQHEWNPYLAGLTGDNHEEAGWVAESSEYNDALQVSYLNRMNLC